MTNPFSCLGAAEKTHCASKCWGLMLWHRESNFHAVWRKDTSFILLDSLDKSTCERSLSLSLSTTLLWLKFSKWNEQHSVKPQDLTHFSTLPFYLLTSYDCELWTLFWLVHRHAPSILHFNLLSSVFQVLSFYPFCFFRYFPIHLRNILPSSTALEQTWLSARIHTPSPLLFILCH